MKTTSSIFTYCFGHFAVDFACGYILYAMTAEEGLELVSAATLFLIYNLLAFGTQFLFGLLADRFASNGKIFAVSGCLAAAAGLIVGTHAPWVCVALMGLGNAAFHVGGGIDAVTRSPGFTRAGMFVSTGALGIALGCHFGAEQKPPVFLPVAVLIFTALCISVFCSGSRREQMNLPAGEGKGSARDPMILSLGMSAVLILGAVLIRSWAGFLAPNGGSESRFAFLIPAAAAFAGKLAGGVLADFFGARRVGTLSVLVSIPLFFVGGNHFILYAAALFFFNIAMPITLVELVRRLRGHEGFAFGLTTLALLLGYLGSELLPLSDRPAKFAVVFLALIAAADLYVTSSDRGSGFSGR